MVALGDGRVSPGEGRWRSARQFLADLDCRRRWLGGPFEMVDETVTTATDKDVITEPTLVYAGCTFCPRRVLLISFGVMRLLNRLSKRRLVV